jgi:hypothetical protein
MLRHLVPIYGENRKGEQILRRFDDFRFVLNTDGTGALYDPAFFTEDTLFDDNGVPCLPYLGIWHNIDLAEYSRRKAIVLTRPRAFHKVNLYQLSPFPERHESDFDIALYEHIRELFYTYNEYLEYPAFVPNDIPVSVEQGEVEELNKAIAVIGYLVRLYYPDSSVVLQSAKSGDPKNTWYSKAPSETLDLISALMETFKPQAKLYTCARKYKGRFIDIRSHGTLLLGTPAAEQTYLPTARERLEAKAWLKELLMRLGLDPSLAEIKKHVP